MGKCALIVDDSRTSRAVLRRVLETHELDVDTAESAEAALEYLTEHRPDVIFMDHLMPGMDGFEAVTAIKRNPRTATIPIMMYTSQKGDVYVGQARALGAVGVLPKHVEPVEVSKILESLHIVGDAPAHIELPQVDAAETMGASDAEVTAVESDIVIESHAGLRDLDGNMRLLLEDLFDQQRSVLKRDILQSSDVIAKRIADHVGHSDEDDDPATVPSPPTPLYAALVASVVVAGILLVLYLRASGELGDITENNLALTAELASQQERSAGTADSLLRELDGYRQETEILQRKTIGIIERGFNRSGQYPFGEEPLGDARISDFDELLTNLESVGFTGQLVVETHVGDHCLSVDESGYRLADPDIGADVCTVRGLGANESLDSSSRQSIAMASFFGSVRERTAGRIRVLVVPKGSSEPAAQYPSNTMTVSAGEWNQIARMNNRIEVNLIQDSSR